MRFLIAVLWLLHWLPLPILGRIGNAVGSNADRRRGREREPGLEHRDRKLDLAALIVLAPGAQHVGDAGRAGGRQREGHR